jgi:hypothetical protein
MTVYIYKKKERLCRRSFLFPRIALPAPPTALKSVSLTFNFDLPVFYLIFRLMPAEFLLILTGRMQGNPI